MRGQKSTLLLAAMVQGEGTPIELINRVESRTDRTIGLAGVYVQLERLHRSGLTQHRKGRDEKGQARRWYRLTADGVAYLRSIELAQGGMSAMDVVLAFDQVIRAEPRATGGIA